MQTLNLPQYKFRIRSSNDKTEIFDDIRKKFVTLTPEEWVRQNFITYLIKEKKFPASLISVEKSLMLNKMLKRTDAVVHSNEGEALLIL